MSHGRYGGSPANGVVVSRALLLAILGIGVASVAVAEDYHVGADRPLKTISAAAELAQPGDVITVHEGTYRELVSPPRSGVVYQAAPGEKVVITGSEIVTGWQRVTSDTWKVVIPNTLFGSFNPYTDAIRGDWFFPRRPALHTGAVYLNGESLDEARGLPDVLKAAAPVPLWFGQVDATNTTLWAQFPGKEPDRETIEINVRKTVFTPEKTGVNDITVRGFTMRHAASNWAPPTAGQFGLLTAWWCKGWLIESNDISYSRCAGIALGKYSDPADRAGDTAENYVRTVHLALKHGWSKETVGSHIVRHNHIHHCEQNGIVGSLGGAFSRIEGNEIHDIHRRQLFDGAEMGAIKLHGAVDVQIVGNHIYNNGRLGIWLDWMSQGARISGNLLHDNLSNRPGVPHAGADVCMESVHGPYLIENNVLLSPFALLLQGQGGAVVHNLIAGDMLVHDNDGRKTLAFKPHSLDPAGSPDNEPGDFRFLNNLFVTRGPEDIYTVRQRKLVVPPGGSLANRAAPSEFAGNLRATGVQLEAKANGWNLTVAANPGPADCAPVTTKSLGNAAVTGVPFENPDGAPLSVNADYFSRPRDGSSPYPGPFKSLGEGAQILQVWPRP